MHLPDGYLVPAEIPIARQIYCEWLNEITHRRLTASIIPWLERNVPPFYLAYQGLNDRGLQIKWGRWLSRLMAGFFRPLPLDPAAELRIGFVSSHFYAHSGAAWCLPWVQELPGQKYLYCLSGRRDPVTEQFAAAAHRFIQRPYTYRLNDWIEQIVTDRLTHLIYPDIGMNAKVGMLAAMRLAPVQMAAWGHPVTSGLPTMDYYLSSSSMEPPGGAGHYSEQLIRLPGLGFPYERPKVVGEYNRGGFFPWLPRHAVLYFCAHNPSKHLPQYDWVFSAIAAQVPRAHFVFLDNKLLQQRMERAGIAARCSFLPWLPRDRFRGLMSCCDIFLDPPGWSAGNTALEGIAAGMPLVTTPGHLMRQRHAAGMLQLAGRGGEVSANLQQYVQRAIELSGSTARERELFTGAFWEDRAGVDALAGLLAKTAGGPLVPLESC